MTFESLTAELMLDADDFQSSASGAENSMESLSDKASGVGKRMQSLGTTLTVGVTAPLTALGAASVKTASDVEEMQSKMNVVFGDLTEDVEAWAEAHAESVNRSAFQMQKYATSIQDTFVPMGFAREEAAQMSKQLTELGVDLASFNNMSESRAMEKLQSGLVGNHEALREFGVMINQSRLEQELLNMGIEEGVQAASEQQKAQARMNLIMQDTADAQGDAARTSDSFANQMRGLKADTEELRAEIGQHLLPVASSLIDHVGGLVNWFGDLDDGQQKIVLGLAGIAAAAGPVLAFAGTLLAMLPAMAAGWAMVTAAMGPISVAILGIAGAIGLLAAAWGGNWGNIRGHTETGVNMVVGMINWLIEKINQIPGVDIGFEAEDVDFTSESKEAESEAEETGKSAGASFKDAFEQEAQPDPAAVMPGGGSGGPIKSSGLTPAIEQALKGGVEGYKSEDLEDAPTKINEELFRAVAATDKGASAERLGVSDEEFQVLMDRYAGGSSGGGGQSRPSGPGASDFSGMSSGGGGGLSTQKLADALREALSGLGLTTRLRTDDPTLDRIIRDEAETVFQSEGKKQAKRADLRGIKS